MSAVKTSAGEPRTMFKPDINKHGYPTNLDYYHAQ
jgi:pyocin large subunit-like protein